MPKAIASILVLSAVLLGATAATAAELAPVAATTDLSSQAASAPRARTRIRVTPARRLVRECSFRLVREVRASGTYVVPQERCWWARR